MSKFILLLRKGIYPYEYMDSWKRFDETSLPDKDVFYRSLNMKIFLILIRGMKIKYSKNLS